MPRIEESLLSQKQKDLYKESLAFYKKNKKLQYIKTKFKNNEAAIDSVYFDVVSKLHTCLDCKTFYVLRMLRCNLLKFLYGDAHNDKIPCYVIVSSSRSCVRNGDSITQGQVTSIDASTINSFKRTIKIYEHKMEA